MARAHVDAEIARLDALSRRRSLSIAESHLLARMVAAQRKYDRRLASYAARAAEAPGASRAPGAPNPDVTALPGAAASIARPVGALRSGQSTSIDPGA